MKKIYYPIAGMNYIVNDLTDLFLNKNLSDKEEVKFYISAQLNSYPHIGTLVNFMSAFEIAVLVQEKFCVPVKVHLDLLENVSGEEVVIDGSKYYKSLKNTTDSNGNELSKKYFPFFKDILFRLKKITNVNYEIQYFEDYQKNKFVKEALYEIMSKEDEIGKIINPKSNEVF